MSHDLTSPVSVIYCIHGLIAPTCSLCKDKDVAQVQAELNRLKEEFSNQLRYDYQELERPTNDIPEDLDFDMDDMSS
ncbi:hypothetical protein EBZ35_05840 [bacterium]|nr:hypothetical protein [bacterium]